MLPTVDAVMAEARAASFKTRSIKAAAKLAGLRLAVSMVDLTTLEGKDSPEKVRGLCAKAVRPSSTPLPISPSAPPPSTPNVAAICVYPAMVRTAREALEQFGGRTDGCFVNVASVATGFPSGQYSLNVRLADAAAAIDDGADEIDMVINRGAFLSGRYDVVAEEIREVQTASVARGAHLKVFLETGELETYDNVRRASDLAIRALAEGAERAGKSTGHGDCAGGFIKTSTGKVQPAATMPVTLVMLEAIRDHFLATGFMVGMKPAGGIRTAKEALHYLVMLKETLGDAWLSPEWFRFGASTLLNDLLRQIARHEQGAKGYAARYDFSEE
jgi:deoxyribose-phosphate aldolase